MSSATQSILLQPQKATAQRASRKKEKTHRSTVTLTTAAAKIVESFKAATGLSTSRAIDELILRSEPRKPRIKMVHGRALIDLPIADGSINTKQLLEFEDESW